MELFSLARYMYNEIVRFKKKIGLFWRGGTNKKGRGIPSSTPTEVRGEGECTRALELIKRHNYIHRRVHCNRFDDLLIG